MAAIESTPAAVASVVDTSKLETRLFINNEFVNAVSGKTFPTVNPATEEVIANVQEADAADVEIAVLAANKAFELGSEWREMNASGRGRLINKLADAIERDQDYLMALESMDNGKPIAKDGADYGTSTDMYLILQHLRYYAGWADKICGKTMEMDGKFLAYTRHEPIGVCGQIIPWNFPMLMMAWKLGPALACGCTVVLKSSEKTPLTALHIAKLIKEVGFPAGVVNVLSGYGPTAGQALARHMKVDKIAFTGSSAVGKLIQVYSGESNLKSVSLELGGKSPMIIFDDADMEQALGAAHVGLFLNQGQCCCAGSRVFVQEGIYDKFVAGCVAKAKERVIGDPSVNGTKQGPQVDKIQFDSVMAYIEKGKAEGANCMTGGARGADKGYFVQPTVFADVTDDMTIAKEEIFGPVMSILKFKTVDEVIKRANDTMYGLGAGLCTRDIGKAIRVAHSIRAGSVWVNCYDKFDATAPFGGFKQSGIGREGGEYGLKNYYKVKVVMVPIDR